MTGRVSQVKVSGVVLVGLLVLLAGCSSEPPRGLARALQACDLVEAQPRPQLGSGPYSVEEIASYERAERWADEAYIDAQSDDNGDGVNQDFAYYEISTEISALLESLRYGNRGGPEDSSYNMILEECGQLRQA